MKKIVIEKDIKHEDFKNVSLNKKQIRYKTKTIRSQNRKLGSYEINKISLSCFDDKRYIFNDTQYTII